MAVRPRAILIATAIASFVVFAAVQDRVTAAGARRYVVLQRAALAGRGRMVTVDEIMRPAVERSVRLGLMWGGVVLVGGVGLAAAASTRGAAGRDPGTGIRDPKVKVQPPAQPGSGIPAPDDTRS
jgi:hypothetical protein